MEVTYQRRGDYLLPELTIGQTQQPIGKYGLLRKEFLKREKRVQYNRLLIKGELMNHLFQVQTQAEEELARLIELFSQAENLSEEMKNNQPLDWTSRRNRIKKQAEELILARIIFA